MNVETKLIQSKLGPLKLAEKLGNVSEACQVYGYSRDSFDNIFPADNGQGKFLSLYLTKKQQVHFGKGITYF